MRLVTDGRTHGRARLLHCFSFANRRSVSQVVTQLYFVSQCDLEAVVGRPVANGEIPDEPRPQCVW